MPISGSSYRLVESGGAILQPAHTPELVKVFQSLAWPRVVAYIVCAQAAEPSKADNARDVWEVARTVATLEPGLDRLVNTDLRPLWANQRAHIDESESSTKLCLEAVRRYLEGMSPSEETPTQASPSLIDWASQAPDFISPIHLDLLLQQLETLDNFPAKVPPAQFKIWENRNYTEFQDVYAFVTDLDRVAANASQYQYDWLYLQLQDFKQVHILCGPMKQFVAGRNALIRNIAKLRAHSASPGKALIDEISKKIRIEMSSQDDSQQLLNLLRSDQDNGRLLSAEKTSEREIQLENVWIYRLKRNNITVGFADNYQGEAPFVTATLSKGEVAMLLSKLKSHWV